MNLLKAPARALIKCSIVSLYGLSVMSSAFADDTEIFLSNTANKSVTPNVLFIFDTSGSMNRSASGDAGSASRIDVMRDVMYDFITNTSNLNIGMARFSVPGGPILNPVVNIDAAADPIALATVGSSNDDATENTNNGQMNFTEANISFNLIKDTDLLGVRFTDLAIPQGARITKATLTLSTYDNTSGYTKYEIFGDKSGDSVPLTSLNLSARTPTDNSIDWLPEDWETPNPLFENGDLVPPSNYSSPDLSPVVQEIVNTDTWCGGNSLSLIIRNDSGYSAFRNMISYDGSPLYAPRLRVEFDPDLPPTANGCYINRAIRQISNSDYDFENNSRNGIQKAGTSLSFNQRPSGRPNDGIGLHFDNIVVPQGATVIDAHIEFTSTIDRNGNANATIQAVDSNNATSDAAGIVSALKLSGVSWSLPNMVANIIYQTPSLKSSVQSIVSKGGWESGNGISFYISTPSGARTVQSFEGNPVRAPRLVINYRGSYDGSGYTKRDEMKQVVQDFQASGNTPISDTLLEAGIYYRAEKVLYGLQRGSPANRYNRVSHPNSFDATGVLYTPSGCSAADWNSNNCRDQHIKGDPNYVSPIVDSCQANHIVLLTDGAPTSHNWRTGAKYNEWSGSTCSGANSGRDCAVKIAGFLQTKDQASWIAGNQKVSTHVIGFDYSSSFLSDIAEAGNGLYETADNKESLLAALEKIAATVLRTNTTFVSAGVTVNQYNRLTNSDELYYSLFQPDSSPSWPGNIKRYRLDAKRDESGNLVLDSYGRVQELVRDVNANVAINEVNGEFDDRARSWWSPIVDGNEVALGGVASKMTVPRRVYTNIASASSTTSSANRVELSNGSLTRAVLGVTNDLDRDNTIKWAQGYNVDSSTPTSPHYHIGDPLHSKPTLLTYKVAGGFESVIFVGTNQGFVHAFDSETGNEYWSFVPDILLGNLYKSRKNEPSTQRFYGMDGSVSLYVQDNNASGTKGVVDSGDKAILVIGMRRGGSSYYAFDVTDFNNPQLMYEINPSKTGFGNLGQTWSTPVIGKMNLPGVNSDKLVLVFGGGYDTNQDDANTAANIDAVGNRVFIADALTGQYLWDNTKASQAPYPAGDATSNTALNSVPSRVRAFDITGDDLFDHFYVSDTRAQIFRFDVNNVSGAITGGRIAKLQEGLTANENRRFYYEPDVSLTEDKNTGEYYVAVSIGSGYRAHPLNLLVSDHFYVVRDRGVLSRTWKKDVGLNDLLDITAMFTDSDGDGMSDAAVKIKDDNLYGWYLRLQATGEKVLAESVTQGGVVMFNTYLPPASSAYSTGCAPAAGSGRHWGLAIEDGQPVGDINGDGLIDQDDRYLDIPGLSGIPPGTQLLLTGDGNLTGCIARLCGIDEFIKMPNQALMPIKWRHLNPGELP